MAFALATSLALLMLTAVSTAVTRLNRELAAMRTIEAVRMHAAKTGKLPKTLEEIGQDFGISRERVRQLQNVALERLRRRRLMQQMR